MTRYAKYTKRFNADTIANEQHHLSYAEQREVERSKNQDVNQLRESRNFRTKPVCLKCRKRGHSVKYCPAGTESICYNCGSHEHTLKMCREPRTRGLPFASCFICKGQGHLAGQCPKNDKGIYPRGGGCRFCGSNQHLARDCRPTRQADAGNFVGLSLDPKRENPDEDLLFESLNNIQKEKDGKEKSSRSASSANKAKVVSF